MTERTYEPVLTVTDYYDGPRTGIAEFDGKPHRYERGFSEELDAYDAVFDLWPVDREELELALEDWRIWERWEAAHREGRTSLETHPALPEDRLRHDQISANLENGRLMQSRPTIRAAGEFRKRSDGSLEVRWTLRE